MPMKISSLDQGLPPAERSKAWSYLITNLLVLPGLGSVMAGQKASGYLQMLLALVGSVITLVAVVKLAWAWVQEFQLPGDPALYRWTILGIGIFLVSWIWSLLTSLALFRQKP